MSPLFEGEDVLAILFEGKVPQKIGNSSWRSCLGTLLQGRGPLYIPGEQQREGVRILTALVKDDGTYARHIYENTDVWGMVKPECKVLTFEERQAQRERLKKAEFEAFFEEEAGGRRPRRRL